jgi:ABC-type multidrug transport system ATPase subunit
LDPIVTRGVEEAVKTLAAQGKCILLSTHLLDQVEEICSRVGIIGQGRVLAEGTLAELCAQTNTPNLRRAFFAIVDTASGTGVSPVAPRNAGVSPAAPAPGSAGGFGGPHAL